MVAVCEVVRSGRTESLHMGAAAVADSNGALLAVAGNPGLSSYLRSAAKPIQLLAMLESGLDPDERLDSRALAIMAASHGGEPAHVKLVEELLTQAGISPNLLRCGPAPPLDVAAHRSLVRRDIPPAPIHNNCSGKHTAMLWTCRILGWPMDSYLQPDHPLQRAITARVAELCGEVPGVGVDGCSVPTFFVSLLAAARMVARFTAMAAKPGPAARVFRAMTEQPWFTSATNRLPYLLMTRAAGLLAKEGAEGFFVVGIPADRSPWGCPAGMAVKVLDGSGENQRGREPGVVNALKAAGVLTPSEALHLEELRNPALVNAAGLEVGEVRGTLTLEAPEPTGNTGARS